jgi:plasmid maintenance system antidote protein VapI
MTKKFKPNYAIHPGEYLKENIEFDGISFKKLSRLTLLKVKKLKNLTKERIQINVKTAIKLSCYRHSPIFWTNFQENFNHAIKRLSRRNRKR